MMTEISLNILDVAQNSVRAEATLIKITVDISRAADRLTVTISDDGCGMSEEQLKSVTDPFFTTRTTRKIGLGIPFFKQSAELTGGNFEITSKPGFGTKTVAVYVLSSIDRMPLGNMSQTIHSLVTMNTHIDFLYTYSADDKSFTLDTREFKEILGEDADFAAPEVSAFIMDFLKENHAEVSDLAE
ncbi:MAG: ATP-binding protein [Ruminococcus sp.]|nr:ATP-binding protein [Ruminococcus sp.]MCM1381967.1 ATP-binding protein [Muribaculaceae bacterium]MCM1479841.1 ATP-binding protein [Muribaculaceae bacterium]